MHLSRDTTFTGWWEGSVEIRCDGCKKKRIVFQCFDEDDFKNYEREKRALKKEGWNSTKVNGQWKEFCSEDCRNSYIRKNTI